MRLLFVLALLLSLGPLGADPSAAQAVKAKKAAPAPPASTFSQEQERQKVNENMLVLMSGGLGGPYLQLANDIAVVNNDGDNLRVLPVVSSGSVSNVRDVLLAKGVDLGITTVQILNDLRASGELGPSLERQIAYIAPLTVETLHVLVGPEAKSIQDLKGKKVSFNLQGSGTARFGPRVFKSLGVEVDGVNQVYLSQGDAIQAIRKGEIGASLCTCQIPIPAFADVKADWGFRLLAIPYLAAFEQDYVPASLSRKYYPNLIAEDAKVETIATTTVLVSFNWPPGTERYRRIERFVDAFFSNMDKLRRPPRHPLWQEVNIAASIRGWQRFAAAQQWLDRRPAGVASQAPAGGDGKQPGVQPAATAPGGAAEQERLFNEFLEWSRKRQKR
jgi:uncharacterized protein